jgi:stage III sporulation protein AF
LIWLADWLKSIIFVLLLATFADILLPNQTMQRYVKTVMSLFILLTLLQPVVSLFHKQTSMEELFAGVEAHLQRSSDSRTAAVFSPTQGVSAPMQTLDDIGRQAEQLKARQEEQSRQLVQKQIGDLMKQNVEQASPEMTVQQVQVETDRDASGQLQIRRATLQVALQLKKPLTKNAQPGAVKSAPIEPVKPVNISVNTQIDPIGSARKEDTDASTVSGSSIDYEQEKTQIRMLLNKVWQIPPERIAVEVMEQKTKP